MTDRSEINDRDQAADRWLDQHQRSLMCDLDAVLDVEAGLREVLLVSRPAILVDDLDAVLDVDAGLREVLPAAEEAPTGQHEQSWTPQGDAAPVGERPWPVSPLRRIKLRGRPLVVGTYLTLTLARRLELTLAGARFLSSRHHSAAPQRVLLDALAIDIDLANALYRHTRGADRPRAFVPHLVRMQMIVRDLATGRPLEVARGALDDLIHDLTGAMDPSSGIDLTPELAHVVSIALDLLHDLAGHHRGGPRVVNAHLLAGDLVANRTTAVVKVINRVLRRELPTLAEDVVDAFLNDFTRADLRHADLDRISLLGVRWSLDGTKWPANMDVDDLKARSRETPPDSGIWIVQAGKAKAWGFAEQQ